MKSKFSSTSISKRKVIQDLVLQDFEQKNHFLFERWSWFKFINFGTGSRLKTGSGIKVIRQYGMQLKIKVRKIWGLIPSFVEGP